MCGRYVVFGASAAAYAAGGLIFIAVQFVPYEAVGYILYNNTLFPKRQYFRPVLALPLP